MGHLKTYIVEDSPVIRENLIAALEELVSVDVVGTAADENTAVQWLSSDVNACDLMIVDVFLAQGSGLGVLKAARQQDKPTKLVVLSKLRHVRHAAQVHRAGRRSGFRQIQRDRRLDGLLLRLSSGDSGNSAFSALS